MKFLKKIEKFACFCLFWLPNQFFLKNSYFIVFPTNFNLLSIDFFSNINVGNFCKVTKMYFFKKPKICMFFYRVFRLFLPTLKWFFLICKCEWFLCRARKWSFFFKKPKICMFLTLLNPKLIFPRKKWLFLSCFLSILTYFKVVFSRIKMWEIF